MVANLAEAKEHPITPEDFLRHDSEIRTGKRVKDEAATAFAGIKKSAKSGAVDMEAYKFIERLRRLEPDEQSILVRHIVLYATWLKMPIGTQFSMMDAPKVPAPKAKATQEHIVWQAGEAGLRAGRDGEPSDANPFVNGTETFAAWAKNHKSGLGERATAGRMQDEDTGKPVADAGRATNGGRGRGRGKRKGNGAGRSGDQQDDILAGGRAHLGGNSALN
jgi:hypothetical protein